MKNQVNFITDFLFSTPSFTSGIGSVINIAGNYYEFNTSETGLDADEIALKNDFNMIGQDIKQSLDSIILENK